MWERDGNSDQIVRSIFSQKAKLGELETTTVGAIKVYWLIKATQLKYDKSLASVVNVDQFMGEYEIEMAY